MQSSFALALSCFLGTALAAQSPCPRPPQQLSSGATTTSFNGFNGWRTAASATFVAADPANNLYATNQVVYAVFPDLTANGNAIVCRRSVDGGDSWQAPTEVHLALSGETFDSGEIEVAVDGHTIAVVFTSDLETIGGIVDPLSNDRTFLAVSNDQGQTWARTLVSTGCNNALSTGDLFGDCDEPVVAVGGDPVNNSPVIHVAFEADYQNAVGIGAAATNEDIYYAVYSLGGGGLVPLLAEEVRVDSLADVTGEVDSDSPAIIARGSEVSVLWQDDRLVSAGGGAGNGAANNTYVKTSQTVGTDMATVPEVDVTGFTALIGFAARRSALAYGNAGEIYVFNEDSRNGTNDDLWLHKSTDGGATFAAGVRIDGSPVGVDSDGMVVAVSGSNIAVQYLDDRQAPNNTDNDIYVSVSTDGGATFTEYLALDTPASDCTLYRGDAKGDVFAFSHETSGFPEDSSLIFSTDAGATWEVCAQTSGGTGDTDDCAVSVTLNGDITGIWQDDRNNGNTMNNVYATGLKAQRVGYDSQARAFRLTDARSSSGGLAVLIPSLSPPSSLGLPANLTDGIALNFTADALTLAALDQLLVFSATIDAAGNATWPGFPNFSRIIGQDIYYAVFCVTTDFTADFTDTIVVNP